MKTTTNFKKGSHIARSPYSLTVKSLFFSALILTGIRAPLQAQVATTEVAVLDPEVGFSVNSPRNIPVELTARETFPIRNYVFFNIGSTEIPDRYVLLSKDQVKYFKEDELVVTAPKNLSGRSGREMIVYYNVLNILGDRMRRNPSTTIMLVGTSEKSPEDGWAMGRPIKKYLVSVFGIDAVRVSIAGRYKIPSKQPGSSSGHLLREEDRKVSIESSSPDLLIAFQSSPDAMPNPVEIIAAPEALLDSYVSFNVGGRKRSVLDVVLGNQG